MTDPITRTRALIAELWELRREAERVAPGAVAHVHAAIVAVEAELARQEANGLRDQLRLSFGSAGPADDTA